MRMSRRVVRAAGIVAALCCVSAARAASVEWVASTNERPWQTMPAPHFTPDPPDAAPEIRIAPDKTAQTIDGFGGCFNELGWAALNKLPAAERDKAVRALFADDGAAFTLARIPIGSSDFATSAYSLDDTPGDYELKHFSVDRDRKLLLPFVKAAMAVRPTLKCWASPWSPPAWMKTNGHYSKGRIKWEPAVLSAYAEYFVRFIDAYRGEGVSLYAITPQNEPNILSPYPSCEWTGPMLRDFIGGYLGPTLKAKTPGVELWLGLNGDPLLDGDNANARLTTVMDDAKASSFITGIAFQYDSRTQIATAHAMYPDKKLMQSETECNGGKNSWADAQKLYGLMKRYFDHGANAYFMWNMVLDETGIGPWKWRQNAPITADTRTGELRFNGEYYVMRHFSRYVMPGAKKAMTSGPWGDQIGFVNPDGSAVLVVGNSSGKDLPVRIGVGGRDGSMAVTLAAGSIHTFVIPAD